MTRFLEEITSHTHTRLSTTKPPPTFTVCDSIRVSFPWKAIKKLRFFFLYLRVSISPRVQANSLSFLGSLQPGGIDMSQHSLNGKGIPFPGGCQGHPASFWKLLVVLNTFAGWWFQPLWKILVNWDDYSKYMKNTNVPKHQPEGGFLKHEGSPKWLVDKGKTSWNRW